MAKITINLNDSEIALKRMIQELIETNSEGNPYYKRSESFVAKLVLEKPLSQVHIKYVNKKK